MSNTKPASQTPPPITITTTTTTPEPDKSPSKKRHKTRTKPRAKSFSSVHHHRPRSSSTRRRKTISERTLRSSRYKKSRSPKSLSRTNTPPKTQVSEKTETPITETITEIKPLPKLHPFRNRLLIGEGNLSYARALIEKYHKRKDTKGKSFGSSITATTFKHLQDLKDDKTTLANIQFLQTQGTTFRAGIDGTKLHTYTFLKDHRFKRIHFNFPHDGSDTFKDHTLSEMIKKFFASAAKLQKPGDRIHMALSKPIVPSKRKFNQGYIYEIYDASKSAFYKLVKVRKFADTRKDFVRYPGYTHSGANVENSKSDFERSREYIFEKVEPGKEIPKPEKYSILAVERNCLDEPTTDSDSSDYYDSNSE